MITIKTITPPPIPRNKGLGTIITHDIWQKTSSLPMIIKWFNYNTKIWNFWS